MEIKTKNSTCRIVQLHSTATNNTRPRQHRGVSTRGPKDTRRERDDMIHDDFKGDEKGREVQLAIDIEVDEDRCIFDLHC